MGSNSIIGKRCDEVIFWSLTAMIFFVPVSTAIIKSLFGFAMLSFLIKRTSVFFNSSNQNNLPGGIKNFISSFKPQPSILNTAISIFLFVTLLSTFFSYDVSVSLKTFFTKVFLAAFLYFLTIESFTTVKKIKIFLTVFIISACLISINGIVQYWWGMDFFFGKELIRGRVVSTFAHPNDFGAYLVVILIILLAFLLQYPRPAADRWLLQCRYLMLAGFILLIITLGLTFSRGSWLSFYFGLLLLGFMFRKKWFILLFIFICFNAIFIPALESTRNVSFISDNVESAKISITQGDSAGNSFQKSYNIRKFTGMGRKHFWKAAITVIKDHPVFGVGLKQYVDVLRAQYKEYKDITPHNSFLHLAAETGLVALGSFLYIIFLVIKEYIGKSRLLLDDFQDVLFKGIFVAIGCFLVHAFFDTTLYSRKLEMYFWLMMGVFAVILKNKSLLSKS